MPTTATRAPRRPVTSETPAAAAFATELGWMAVAFEGDRLAALSFDHPSRHSALAALPHSSIPAESMTPAQRRVIDLLTAYAAGQQTDLRPIQLAARPTGPFAARVIEACRNIPYGEVLTYAQLAAIAGSPGAARAVGNVMASNRYPLVVPCHRVVGAHGSLGGYSARGGLAVKRRLLQMEAGVPA